MFRKKQKTNEDLLLAIKCFQTLLLLVSYHW